MHSSSATQVPEISDDGKLPDYYARLLRKGDLARRGRAALEFLKRLISSDFLPHGTCYLWDPHIVWLHVISDSLITLAYYCIPLALVYLVRKRRDLPFN